MYPVAARRSARTAKIRRVVDASANTAATNPSCSFLCTCGGVPGPIVIDGSDGLPVELMALSVE